VTMPSSGFVPLDTVDPTARMSLRAGVGQTVPQTARMYQQATDAAGSGGTIAARGIRAFHGSPHDFDRFRMDRIGTGEGAQAYGHGLYFAENEGVARGYRDSLSGRVNPYDMRALDPDPAWIEAARSMWRTHSPEQIRDVLRQAYRSQPPTDAQLDVVMQAANPGRMYEVSLNVDPNRLLDWDAPLSQQPQPVRDVYERGALRGVLDLASVGRSRGDIPGADLHNLTGVMEAMKQGWSGGSNTVPQIEAARVLRDAGIPGIRYLDQGSRGAGQGTRNYVITDEDRIEILRKYGLIPGMLGGGGAAGLLGGAGESE
jgi:hypothetical protein